MDKRQIVLSRGSGYWRKKIRNIHYFDANSRRKSAFNGSDAERTKFRAFFATLDSFYTYSISVEWEKFLFISRVHVVAFVLHAYSHSLWWLFHFLI